MGLAAACLALSVVTAAAAVVLLQLVVAHRQGFFAPQYEKRELRAVLSQRSFGAEEQALLLRQTGLGRGAVELLKAQGEPGIQKILQTQQAFFAPRRIRCAPMLGWFTREDIMTDEAGTPLKAPPIVAAQPGDIIISLSTHSFGWKHGHAGLVIDGETTLESRVLGQNSETGSLENWRRFSSYAVLRVKGSTPAQRQAVAQYGMEVLHDVPYRLTAGMFREKAATQESPFFGLQCAYLVWYAWQHFGVDLDSDGGRIVTPRDLCLSDRLEVVQVYGLDPEFFCAAASIGENEGMTPS